MHIVISVGTILPRCILCRAVLHISEMSVRPSIRLANAWNVRKRKKLLRIFLYCIKDPFI